MGNKPTSLDPEMLFFPYYAVRLLTMKNENRWEPTKFVFRNNKLRGSRNRKHLYPASRLIGDITARFYGKVLPQYAKGTLLDLGCGRVPLYEAYKDHVEEIICADWENTLHKTSYLDFEQDLHKKIKLKDKTVDTVILSDVLEHLLYPRNAIKEVYRLLRKDGVVILNVPFFYWIHEEPHDFHRYTEFALRTMLEEEGFTIELLEPAAGVLEVMADIWSKFLTNIPVAGLWFAACVQWFALLWFNSKPGYWYAKRSGRRFPLGYQVVARKK